MLFPRISLSFNAAYCSSDVANMISPAQLRAARALLGIDQRKLAALSRLSVPTIQRMEASEGVIRGNVDSLMKLVGALDAAGIELIAAGVGRPPRGRGGRPKAGYRARCRDRFARTGLVEFIRGLALLLVGAVA